MKNTNKNLDLVNLNLVHKGLLDPGGGMCSTECHSSFT